MRTPAGKDCRYYYEDFNRGKALQQCRLVEVRAGQSLPWRPSDCSKCPVPDIVSANASPELLLHLSIRPVILGIGRRLNVSAECAKHKVPIDDPYVGCPQCNAERPGLDQFIRALEEDS